MQTYFFTFGMMMVGYAICVVGRAYLKVTSNFDFLLWLKYDFNRNIFAVILSLLVSVVAVADVNSLQFFANFLNANSLSPAIIGFGIAGGAMVKGSDNPTK